MGKGSDARSLTSEIGGSWRQKPGYYASTALLRPATSVHHPIMHGRDAQKIAWASVTC